MLKYFNYENWGGYPAKSESWTRHKILTQLEDI